MVNIERDHVASYYAATINEPVNYPNLEQDILSDVCVVGAGFTGVNTALNLVKKGYSVVLIDSARVGWGASGRNGGQLISGFTFSNKFEKFGEEVAQSVWKLGADCTDLVRETIDEFQIECDLKEGFIEVALNNAQMDELVVRKEEWDQRGYQHNLTLVEKNEITNYVGSSNYIGGMIDSGSGHLHPLNLVLGEAKAASNLGVSIYEKTCALKVNPGKRLLFGGRWNYSGKEPKNIDYHLRKRMLKVFPELEDLRIDYAWGGNVAVTIYRIPQLGKLTENIFYSQGYSGHGVGPTHMAAKVIANAISNEWDMIDTLSHIKHIQLPGGKWFSSPAMALGMVFYRLQDFWASKS